MEAKEVVLLEGLPVAHVVEDGVDEMQRDVNIYLLFAFSNNGRNSDEKQDKDFSRYFSLDLRETNFFNSLSCFRKLHRISVANHMVGKHEASLNSPTHSPSRIHTHALSHRCTYTHTLSLSQMHTHTLSLSFIVSVR